MEEIRWVILNVTYGGLRFSDAFKQAFETQFPDKVHLIKQCEYDADVSVRSDPDLVRVVRSVGLARSSKNCRISLRPIFEDLIEYARITEYDGWESLQIRLHVVYGNLLKRMFASPTSLVGDFEDSYNHIESMLQRYENLPAFNEECPK